MLAVPRAQIRNIDLASALLVSDAFFPFDDIIKTCSDVGIKNILQPGGSLRDPEVIDRCNQLGISMGFTQVRHFRH
jgi:phosphoribosylaminoimidazolecarboxamide formyltransferase/IMP cyclohydrolase